jgi:hypothetical protein
MKTAPSTTAATMSPYLMGGRYTAALRPTMRLVFARVTLTHAERPDRDYRGICGSSHKSMVGCCRRLT